MKQVIKIILAFYLPFIALTSLANEHCEEGLIVGWESWPPYQYINNQGQLTGIDIELARLVFEYLDCSITFVEVPWKRHLQAIEDGTIQVALGSSYTKERAEYAHFSSPYRQELVSLFMRKGKETTATSIGGFLEEGKQLGITLGYYYGEELTEILRNKAFPHQIRKVRENPQLYQMLSKKRIDGFLADTLTVSHQANEYREIFNFDPVLYAHSAHIHFMLSKAAVSSKLVRKLNRQLEILKKEKKLYLLINRYLLPDFESLPVY